MKAGWIVGTLCGLILVVAAAGSWAMPPLWTAVLVGVAVVVMSVWQWLRRRRGIAPVSTSNWVTIGVPVLFGALAVTALNGWIMQVSRDADDHGSVGTELLIGFATGVVFMAAAYGYGRVRAQKVQQAEQQYGAAQDPGDDEIDPNEWLRTFSREDR
ncbi:MAG: hypothetical protein QM774_03115 [Gordonia sp. (in: high G+C Gram-positive bacteria)]|uniref:hypothetical protein n=1 Tax=Gordonia sp. (in: high G+C Gram-positive bacteria) TaxID=84139 RepID=UPI0039E35355